MIPFFRRLVKKTTVVQFIRFCIVGVSNVIVSYISYVIFFRVTRNLFVANLSGYIFSLINAFFWNNGWVFKKSKGEIRNALISFVRMIVSYGATGIVLNYILLVVWVQFLGISEFIAPLINSIIGIPINFILNKFWCFKAIAKRN